MNIFGKILVWVVVVIAGADFVLSARLLQIKNSWSKAVENLDRENKDSEEKLVKNRKELENAEVQYARAVAGWDTFWSGIAARKNPADNTLIVGLGQKHGMGIQRPVLNAFRLNGDGSSTWVGRFRVDPNQINLDTCTLIPTWNLRKGETDKWTDDNKWRFRASIPTTYPSDLLSLYSDLELADDKISNETILLAGKKMHLDAAKRERDGYDAKLLGDANTGKKGLIVELKQSESQRNAVLKKLD